MTTDAEREANIALVRRVADEVLSRGNLSVVDETFVPEFGARWKQSVVTLRATFPDWHYTIEEALAIDDKVVIRVTAHGTHTGVPYWCKPATGKEATMGGIVILRLADGKIAQIWGQYDYLSQLQQLGILPSQAEIVAANEAAADTPA